MSAATETDILRGLDFTVEYPCEAPNHASAHADQSASLVWRTTCPGCGYDGGKSLICESGYGILRAHPAMTHAACGTTFPGREFIKEVTPL